MTQAEEDTYATHQSTPLLDISPCSVHLLRAGDRALLIDLGTDLCPQTLTDDIGVFVQQLLLTHFHRDQCAGVDHWQASSSQVTIPFAERRFFEQSDLVRASYDTFDNYTAYYQTSGPLADVRGAVAVWARLPRPSPTGSVFLL